MSRRFVVEAVLTAIYSQLLLPGRQVEYIIPYSTLMELYELRETAETIMIDAEEDQYVRENIAELIAFIERPLNRKKIEKVILQPWKMSAPLLVNEEVSFLVVHALEHAQYGEMLDPIETELVITASRLQAPILTDQYELIDKMIDLEIPVQVVDIEDFEYAIDEDISV